MKPKKRKHGGGKPYRDREAVVVRLDPNLVAALTGAATEFGCSRHRFIEMILVAVGACVSDDPAILKGTFPSASVAAAWLGSYTSEAGPLRWAAKPEGGGQRASG